MVLRMMARDGDSRDSGDSFMTETAARRNRDAIVMNRGELRELARLFQTGCRSATKSMT
jgi:hypothetical protein